MITIQHLKEAQKRIHPMIHPTSLEHSHMISDMVGYDVYLKLENLQKTGSFKIRGAFYKIMSLSETQKKRVLLQHLQVIMLKALLMQLRNQLRTAQ